MHPGPSVGWAIKDNLRRHFLRKYATLGSSFYLFGQTDLDFTYTKTNHTQGIPDLQETKTNTTGLPGLAHITYSHLSTTTQLPSAPASEAHASGNTFNAGTTLGSYFQFSVGILYVI